MAKKTSGASEINGFIAVPNEKPRTTSRPGAVKKTSNSTSPSSKSTLASKDAKTVNTRAGPSVRKVAEKEVGKTEAKTVKQSRTVSKPELSKNVKTTTTNNENATTVKKSSTAIKKPTVAKTSEAGSSSSKVTSTSKVQPTASKSTLGATKTSSTSKTSSTLKTGSSSKTGPLKTVSSPSTTKVVTKSPKDSPAAPGNKPANKTVSNLKQVKSRSTSKQPDVQKLRASQKAIPSSKPSSQFGSVSHPSSKTKQLSSAPKPVDKIHSAIPEVVSKGGLSFDITLEPAKAPKPSALPSEIPSDGAVASAVDDSLPPPPPLLVKQRTFVKDEEDEELKSSLPRIIAPDEVEVSRQDDAGQYEDDDFEEYESDFDPDSGTEPSISEASGAISKAHKLNSAGRQKPANLIAKATPNPTTEGPSFTVPSKASPQRASLSEAANPVLSRKSSSETEPLAVDDATNYDYEDDFEDYSSDFEEDTESGFTSSNETTSESSATTESSESEDLDANKTGLKSKVVEEERKLDSGNYDLKTTIARSDVIKLSQLNYIKEAISRENTMFKDG